MEMFSGIPVKALLENDEKTTKLDLSESGCGDTEALVLAECLKVVDLFIFFGMFRVSLVTAPPGNPTTLFVRTAEEHGDHFH